jgi:hypothetical protein
MKSLLVTLSVMMASTAGADWEGYGKVELIATKQEDMREALSDTNYGSIGSFSPLIMENLTSWQPVKILQIKNTYITYEWVNDADCTVSEELPRQRLRTIDIDYHYFYQDGKIAKVHMRRYPMFHTPCDRDGSYVTYKVERKEQ